jgi:DNA modification methylase
MPISQIQQIPIRRLRPNPANSHTHSKKQIAQLARGIERFGFIVPVVVDEDLVIQAGHGRVEAGKTLRLKTVPTIIVSGLSEAERRAYLLADNKLAERAGWDRPLLAAELSELVPLLEEAGLSVDLTGFEAPEIDALMGDLVDPERDPLDEVPGLAKQAVSRRGDLWQLGSHRLLCGDARSETDLRRLTGRQSAAMVFTDPPYNVQISSVQGRGRIRHREFIAASGELSRAEFTQFLIDALRLAAEHSTNGAIHFVFMDWRHTQELLSAGKQIYPEHKNTIVWVKTTPGQGTFYKSQHELIFVFKVGNAPHINNFELGQHGRTRSNVWTYAGANTFRRGRLDELALHPTVKPVALIADAMRDCSRRGDIVLDPFTGSGTTILAAERVGRRAYGLEIVPLYVDVAVRRWQAFTKRDALLKETGQTFDEVAETRTAAAPRQRVR